MDQICNLKIPVWLPCGERMDMVPSGCGDQSAVNSKLEFREKIWTRGNVGKGACICN